MNRNTQFGYTNYFKQGIKFNFLNVSLSLFLSLSTSLILFNNLSSKDFIFYSVSQITIFFFSTAAFLEFNSLISKFFPNMEKETSEIVVSRLIRVSIICLSIMFLIYLVISNYFNLYESFKNSVNLFFFYVYISSFIQILSNYFGQYLSSKQKFHIQEKAYIKYSNPLRALFLIAFYYVFSNLYFVLFMVLFIRIVNLIITFKISNVKYRLNLNNQIDQKYEELFSLRNNFKFTFKNFIFFNYPLLFFSYLPIYLRGNYSESDIAVLTLSISLFNAIKPFLHGVHMIINPSIQQLKFKNDDKKLREIVHLFFYIMNILIFFALVFVWSVLNYTPIINILFESFSYNLFSDLALSAIFLSLFFILNRIYHSYLLSINLENKLFLISFISMVLSLMFWSLFPTLGLKINLSLLIVLLYEITVFTLCQYFVPNLLGRLSYFTFALIGCFMLTLNTYFFSSLAFYLVINILNVSITALLTYMVLKKLKININKIIKS